MLTQAYIREVLKYDPETGVCEPSGYLDKSTGYWRLRVNGKRYYLHQLIWCLMTGEWPEHKGVDHRDTDRANNRWENLRKATPGLQQANRTRQKNCKSGVKGVSLCKDTGRWRADIRVAGKSINLGRTGTIEEAAELYAIAAREHFGEFARMA